METEEKIKIDESQTQFLRRALAEAEKEKPRTNTETPLIKPDKPGDKGKRDLIV